MHYIPYIFRDDFNIRLNIGVQNCRHFHSFVSLALKLHLTAHKLYTAELNVTAQCRSVTKTDC